MALSPATSFPCPGYGAAVWLMLKRRAARRSISPAQVQFGPVKVGGEAERRVRIRGVRDLRITAVRGTGAEVRVRDSTRDSRPVHVLTVTLKGDKAGEVNRTLRVLTDLPDEGEIDFQASGQVVARP